MVAGHFIKRAHKRSCEAVFAPRRPKVFTATAGFYSFKIGATGATGATSSLVKARVVAHDENRDATDATNTFLRDVFVARVASWKTACATS
jgi:hypothetical protein